MPMDLVGIDKSAAIRIEPDGRMSSDEFVDFCQANSQWRIERAADGKINITPPVGFDTGNIDIEAAAQLRNWAKRDRRKFAPICSEFVIEIKSPSDSLRSLKRKMQGWIDNGAELGWLILPDTKSIVIFRAGMTPVTVEGASNLAGEGPVSGFKLDLTDIWPTL